MDSQRDVREFLRSRRAKVTPEQVNLIVGTNRRVPGLRREEVATLASVSVDYYARLERGNLTGVSDEVLEAIAHALRLDEAETAHLVDLARAAQQRPARRRRPAPPEQVVAILRSYAGQRPHDKSLTDLIGELATRSDEFRTRWAAHNVRYHRTGVKQLHHPVVGDLELTYEAMELPANPGWTVFAYTAEPGSASDERLNLLASWAATTASELPVPASDRTL